MSTKPPHLPERQPVSIPSSKGWEADPLGEYLCRTCGKKTPHEVRVRSWWSALFGKEGSGFISGCFPWIVVLLLAAMSLGILGVLVLFFLAPVLQVASLAVGEWLFPTPRRCVVCKVPVTSAEARAVAKEQAAVLISELEARRTTTATGLSAPPPTMPQAAPTEELPALPEIKVVIRITWPGMFFLIDSRFPITFDGEQIATVSISKPLDREILTTTGLHVLEVAASLRRARKYTLDCSKPGHYLVRIEYSRFWGNFANRCKCEMVAASPSPGGPPEPE